MNKPLVRWLALAGVLAALLLLAVGICVGSTGFENLLHSGFDVFKLCVFIFGFIALK